jgi:sugar transferase (PEP-CTERM/EpsH1 system associated)
MNKTTSIPLVVHVIYSLEVGGLENGLINIINRTPSDSYRHAIVCLQGAGEFANRLVDPKVRIICLHAGEGHSFGLYAKIWKVLRGLSPTIVHTRNLATLEAQMPAWLLPGVKTVHGEHGRDGVDLEGQNRKYNLLRRFIRPMVGRYISVSKDLERWLLETIGVADNKIRQIYNGVDQDNFFPALERNLDLAPAGFLSDDSIVIGTVGRLAAVKDQAALLAAFALLLQAASEYRDRLRLIIVGDGPLYDPLRQQLQELGIEHSVWMAGDRQDVSELLRLFDLFVLPSLGEGISNTVLEAMATGLPIVATAVGGNPELVEEGVNGRLVPVGDHRMLAGVLEQLIEQPSRLKTMGSHSLDKVRKQFNWDNTVAEYLAVYDDLLGRKQEAE